MKKRIYFSALILFVVGLLAFQQDHSNIVFHSVDPSLGKLKLYWKDSAGKIFGNLGSVKKSEHQKGKTLKFAMNGGMYLADQSPQGLFIQDRKQLKSVNRVKKAYGNFYMQPNGIFLIDTNNQAKVLQTDAVIDFSGIKFATQSGPMLVIDGDLHPRFRLGSTNLHVRNGVGLLPDGKLLFAQSKTKINFYDFAQFFKKQGCKNALYLDGFVSRTYLPSKNWEQLDGKFGVIIGEVD